METWTLSRFREALARLTSRTSIHCVFLFLAGVIVHYPALQGQLIWDDEFLVRNNPFAKSPLLAAESFHHYLSLDGASKHYRPVQNISYSLDYLLWNTNTWGYHLTNLLLHVGSGILLYLLLHELLKSLTIRPTDRGAAGLVRGLAFTVSLLWIVHPVHSAAVDYISGRADSLAFFFACGAWLLFLKASSSSRRIARCILYGFAALGLMIAVCARETGCIWVILFLFHLIVVDRRTTNRRKSAVLLACLALIGVYAGLRQLPCETVLEDGSERHDIASRSVLMVRAVGDYARLTVWPSSLHVERSVEVPLALRGLGWRQQLSNHALTVAGLLAAGLLLSGALWNGSYRSIRAFGAAWFMIAFLPISNLVPLNATVAEHWLYLPSVGLLLFITGLCLELPSRFRPALVAISCLATVGFGSRSFVRSGDWLTPETFYRHALGSGAAKTRMALNLGLVYAEDGNYAKAEPLLRKVVEMAPDYPMAQNALGHLLLRQGKREEAEKVFAIATQLAERTRAGQTRTWIAALNVAYMQYRDDDLTGALVTVQEATAVYPETWPLINLHAELLTKTQGAEAAISFVQEFAAKRWWHFQAALTLGRLYLQASDLDDAERVLRRASRLDIHDAESLNLLSLIAIRQGRLDEAYQTQRRAVARQPDEPRQYLMLSEIQTKMGRTGEADASLAQVTRLQSIARAQPLLN